MRAALLAAPACLCLAIDRHFQDEAGIIGRSMCCIDMETEVNMPVFLNQSLQYDYTGYIPVAGTAHMGMDLAGHCRALLKIQPTMISDTQAAAFLETEDGLAPRPIWRTPSWFAQNATVVWMVRTDFLRMHVYATFTQDNPMTEPSSGICDDAYGITGHEHCVPRLGAAASDSGPTWSIGTKLITEVYQEFLSPNLQIISHLLVFPSVSRGL